jgi:two-component system, cell cycle response regulator CpdR
LDSSVGSLSKRLLVVEDEEQVCALMTDILGDEGFAVTCVLGDRAAYEALAAEGRTFRALIIDIDLGKGTTGFDVARYARTLIPDLPVIFVSGIDDGSVDRFGVPGSGFVRKPFTPAELVDEVKARAQP